MDANNGTADTFSHTSNIQRENAKTIFTSEKLDLAGALKDLTINDAEYYESYTAIVSDAQFDPTRDPKTFTCTSNRNEKVTDTSNGDFEQKLLSKRTLPVVFPSMNPSIDQSIATIVVASQTLLMSATKEVVVEAVSVDTWVNRTPRRVRRTGINRSTQGNMGHVVSVEHATSPVLILIVSTSPPVASVVAYRLQRNCNPRP